MKRIFKNKKKQFVLIVDKRLNMATGKFTKYKRPLKTVEIDDELVLYIDKKTHELVAFTFIHLGWKKNK